MIEFLVVAVIVLRIWCGFRASGVILKRDGTAAYMALPEPEAMVFHPNYWLKWTVADWREYLSRRRP